MSRFDTWFTDCRYWLTQQHGQAITYIQSGSEYPRNATVGEQQERIIDQADGRLRHRQVDVVLGTAADTGIADPRVEADRLRIGTAVEEWTVAERSLLPGGQWRLTCVIIRSLESTIGQYRDVRR